MPKGTIRRNGKQVKREDLTEEELSEVLLYQNWKNSDERAVLEAYKRNRY